LTVVHRADCTDCGWVFEDKDLVEVTDELEDHSQKEHHHVEFERAAITDGGQDVEVVDEGPEEWCDWCNHEYEDGPTWTVAGDLVTGYFCSRSCAESWGCAGDDPERIDQTEAATDGGTFQVEQTALDGGQPEGQTTLDGGIDKDGGRRD
jgi:hypothetical protein